MHRLAKSLIPLLFWCGPALTADIPVDGALTPAALGNLTGNHTGLISELRLGMLAHDPWSPESGSVDINGQILFAKPVLTGSELNRFIPRPHVGGSLNTSGKTSHLHAGLTWTFDVTAKIFVEASLGGAVHNGKTMAAVPNGRNSLGCSAHFRESAGIGYRIDSAWSVIIGLEHLSNGGLCKHNRGLSNFGMMIGYRF